MIEMLGAMTSDSPREDSAVGIARRILVRHLRAYVELPALTGQFDLSLALGKATSLRLGFKVEALWATHPFDIVL
jgi:hypothetical protein